MHSSVIPLVTLWEKFTLGHPAGDVEHFARWILNQKQGGKPSQVKRGGKPPLTDTATEIKGEAKVMLLIYRLHRFIEMRSKPMINKIGFTKPQEFAMLAEIYLLQKPNKKEVANKMLLEISTAVEISKRLVNRGLVRELSDPNDKRATRLVITEKGMKKLYESYEGLEGLHANFLNCLNSKEKEDLVRMLQELEKFQSALFKNSHQ